MNKKIAVAGTGYVGLSLAVLLAQNNEVTAVDILPEKVHKLNQFVSPIGDEYIEKYLKEAKEGKRAGRSRRKKRQEGYRGKRVGQRIPRRHHRKSI